MAKISGPRNQMMYFRLDPGEAKSLAAIAKAEDRPVSDISRRAVVAYLRGGVEKWAEAHAELSATKPDPILVAIGHAIEADPALAESVVALASCAHERPEARALLLSLARFVAAPASTPKRRARGLSPARGTE